MEKWARLMDMDDIYRGAQALDESVPFSKRYLEAMNLRYEVREEELKNIPKEGPVVLVANHPFGGVEGLVLQSIALSVRSDARIVVNYLLGRIEEFAKEFILVDPFGEPASAQFNQAPMRECLRLLKNGGILSVFPAGGVSHMTLRRREVCDPEWSENIGKLIRRAKATVVPILFEGRNSLFFQLAGLMHPRIRTMLLPRQLVNKRNRTLRIQIGQAIPFSKLESRETDRELIDYLRARTYALAGRAEPKKVRRVALLRKKPKQQMSIEPRGSVERMEADIQALPADRLLVENGDFRGYYATADQIPHLLREIGRCREVTFRGVGEGTGEATDLDRFDNHYTHLFLWHTSDRQLVGAYRLGLVDRIIEKHGLRGLYTHTLFKFNRKLLDKIHPAVEVGRSFVCEEYQRLYQSLMLLWKAIGCFVAAHPEYVNLFGPVSITNDYTDLSRHFLVRALSLTSFDPTLAKLVKPRHPPNRLPKGSKTTKFDDFLDDVEEASEIVQAIEPDGKGMPILIKQYLKLGGRLLAFNIDNAFSSAIDGLIAVDLTKTDPRILLRYLGKTKADVFMDYHGIKRD